MAKYVDANDKSEIISRLPLTPQYLTAAPSTPEPVGEHVLGCYADGQRLKVKHVKQMLRTARRASSEPAPMVGAQSDELMPADEQFERSSRPRRQSLKEPPHQPATSVPATSVKEGVEADLGEESPRSRRGRNHQRR